MNNTITIVVKNKIATNTSLKTLYVCGNSDFKVIFAFDDEWQAFNTKTARFIADNGTYTDVVFQGNECNMPIMENTHIIRVGVFAGNLHTTTPAAIGAKKSILCGSGIPADPAPDVYNQIIQRLDAIETGGTGGGSIKVTDDGAGHVTIALQGLSVTDDGAGHVTVS